MPFDSIMGKVMQWATATEALAAVGAQLSLRQSGAEAPQPIDAALRSVAEAAGLADLDELEPQQEAMIVSLARLYLVQSLDLLNAPDRAPGWTFTDPVILDGWGRGSAIVPGLIAAILPELGAPGEFLDVGTGVGFLAIAAAGIWPSAKVVGIDRWEPSLERARANVAQAGVTDRVELRQQDVVDVDDVDRFACTWVPTFFLPDASLVRALPALVRAAAPGGWIVLGVWRPPADPLAAAVGTLRTIRGGGEDLDAKRGVHVLEKAGCTSVAIRPPPGPMPVDFVVGQKPA